MDESEEEIDEEAAEYGGDGYGDETRFYNLRIIPPSFLIAFFSSLSPIRTRIAGTTSTIRLVDEAESGILWYVYRQDVYAGEREGNSVARGMRDWRLCKSHKHVSRESLEDSSEITEFTFFGLNGSRV